ncbi:MAG: hypothetical protein HYY06_26155 [Deltaproteobacteria bacterium]|nr:hypothetical protein [Deltaproteobacteria bacterium]
MDSPPKVVDESVVRLGDQPLALLLRLATVPGTSEWYIVGLSDPEHPLLEHCAGIVLFVSRKRYSETKARSLFDRVRRAFERGDLGAIRKASRVREDEFLSWAFGLTTLDEALEIKELNDTSHGLALARDRGEITQAEYARQLARATQAIRLRRAFSPASNPGSAGTN